MTIYTKKGDRGTTGFLDGARGNKSDYRPQALGSIDELNSFLGVCYSFSDDPEIRRIVREIQTDLFSIGSIVAGGRLGFTARRTANLEKRIDEWEKVLAPIKNFVFPGGTRLGSLIFYARTLARRAERSVAALKVVSEVRPEVLRYLNRLSDFLFVFARFINFSRVAKEEVWRVD